MSEYSNISYWPGSRIEAAKGLWPHEDKVPQGTILYRFVNLQNGTHDSIADGPWWFEFEYFQKIKHFALQHGYALGYAARLFAAVLYEWSEVDAYVRAEVTAGPLKVWKGPGKQVEAQGKDARDVSVKHGALTEANPRESARMTPMQGHLEVYQLYIPGLGRPHRQFNSLMTLQAPGAISIPTG